MRKKATCQVEFEFNWSDEDEANYFADEYHFAEMYLYSSLKIKDGVNIEFVKIENVEDYCDMTFTITKITQEKHIGGITTIYFVPNDGQEYEYPITITLQNDIGEIDKNKLRQSMLYWYEKEQNSKVDTSIKVGDVI